MQRDHHPFFLRSLCLWILLTLTIMAESVPITSNDTLSLLEKSSVYFDTKNLDIDQIIHKAPFTSYTKPYLNTALSDQTIWIKFSLTNTRLQPINKVLSLTSPLLEHITLYDAGRKNRAATKGHAHTTHAHQTIFPYFDLTIPAQSSETYYLQIYSEYAPMDFSLLLQDPMHFQTDDLKREAISMLLLGVILALMLYSVILGVFIRDRSYLFYGLYLFALLYQQMTYVGLTQIFFPYWFIQLDMKIPIVKITFLIMTSALFAIHFLKISWHTQLQRIYRLFVIVSLAEMMLLGWTKGATLYIVIVTGTLFILFNLYAAIKTYQHGFKEARLFIMGFGIVFVSYGMLISDAVGISSIMQDFQNILMWGTAIEALILSLAFADRYLILQTEKARSDRELLEESKQREAIITQLVRQKTADLKRELTNKKTLLQEVHHRVKNNLQIILAMIRLQNNPTLVETTRQTFHELENRINAIAKTYTLLVESEDLENVDMEEYITLLLQDLRYSLAHTSRSHLPEVKIATHIHARLPLRQAVYLGLIINELVTNSYKHAFTDVTTPLIEITLGREENHCLLKYHDNGSGFDSANTTHSLGLKLVHSLVEEQLEGRLLLTSAPHTHYQIRFGL